ncbi:MAG: formate dehydrogenase accessory protein FdhE [Comamonas sp.]
MSIRIVAESERRADHIAALLLPAATLPYAPRAARLRALAPGHAMADYLQWSAALVDAQLATAQALPLPQGDSAALARALAQTSELPLFSGRWPRSAHWQALLDDLLARLIPDHAMQAAPVQNALAALQSTTAAQREQWADALLAPLRGDGLARGSQLPEAGSALFLWSALSLYWRQLASQLAATGIAEAGAQRHLCPVCGHAPTGSLVLGGAQAGLRYLHCSLCESQWHLVRTTCSNCAGTGALDYWCLEHEKAAIKAESCGDCHSYLKAFYHQTDHALELVADDLASLALDAEMESRGLERSGLNPLMLPALG